MAFNYNDVFSSTFFASNSLALFSRYVEKSTLVQICSAVRIWSSLQGDTLNSTRFFFSQNCDNWKSKMWTFFLSVYRYQLRKKRSAHAFSLLYGHTCAPCTVSRGDKNFFQKFFASQNNPRAYWCYSSIDRINAIMCFCGIYSWNVKPLAKFHWNWFKLWELSKV